MRFGIGDVVEVTFVRASTTHVVFGEILRMNHERFTISVWEASNSLSNWSEVNIYFRDIIDVEANTDPTDFSEIGLGLH